MSTTAPTSTDRAIEKHAPNTETIIAQNAPVAPTGPAYLSLDPTEPIHTFEQAMALGKVLFDSKIYSVDSASKAVVKIIAGAVHGFNPIASMSVMQIIQGNIVMHYSAIAGKIKAHPRYDYKVRKLDNDGCELEIFEDGESAGMSTFSQADAQAAGTGGLVAPGAKGNMLQRFPRNMLFARALSNAARIYCSEVFLFQPVYSEGEIQEERMALEAPKHQDRAGQIIGKLQQHNESQEEAFQPETHDDEPPVTSEEFVQEAVEQFTEDENTEELKVYGMPLDQRLMIAKNYGLEKGALATWQSMDEVPEDEDEVNVLLLKAGEKLKIILMTLRPKVWGELVEKVG